MANGITSALPPSPDIISTVEEYQGQCLVDKVVEVNNSQPETQVMRVLQKDSFTYAAIWEIGNSTHLYFQKYNEATQNWDMQGEIPNSEGSNYSGSHSTAVGYFNGKYYAAYTHLSTSGDVAIYSSADGVTWSSVTTLSISRSNQGICDLAISSSKIAICTTSRNTFSVWYSENGTSGTRVTDQTISTDTRDNSVPHKPFLFFDENGNLYFMSLLSGEVYKIDGSTSSLYDTLNISRNAKAVSRNGKVYISDTSGLIEYDPVSKTTNVIEVFGQFLGMGMSGNKILGVSSDTFYIISDNNLISKYKTNYLDSCLKIGPSQRQKSLALFLDSSEKLVGLISGDDYGSDVKENCFIFSDINELKIYDYELKNKEWEMGVPLLYVKSGAYVGTNLYNKNVPVVIYFGDDIDVKFIKIVRSATSHIMFLDIHSRVTTIILSDSSSVTYSVNWEAGKVTFYTTGNSNNYFNYQGETYFFYLFGTYIGNGLNQ